MSLSSSRPENCCSAIPRATGRGIPKAAPDEGERWIDAAVREAREECGRRLEPAALLELGRFAYRPDKDLALYAVLSERFATACCVCSSFFTDLGMATSGPRWMAFAGTPFADVTRHCARRMAEVLTTTISLPEVCTRRGTGASVLPHELAGSRTGRRCAADVVGRSPKRTALPSRAPVEDLRCSDRPTEPCVQGKPRNDRYR